MRLKKLCTRCRERKDALNEFPSRQATYCYNCKTFTKLLIKWFDEWLNEDRSELREIDTQLNNWYGVSFEQDNR